ncbi:MULTISPECIES: methyltransferase domain-containing protein [unclassified Crossiella]|uniref:methyltransferase domain-containing protein n=1 Tax=unclassified Crossiella TaxID=2620835 RepID=UPI001FFFC9DE|nr:MULTISPECIES: methyltransferase domain-containing protein [unclassified Crossiella]MCK2243199.1 methyltransferase domain-containing protein [Crossiella sp. S99.2]MCK2254332.1 methyltransferase domain-containing protein [Crossiella sp. S99.1]
MPGPTSHAEHTAEIRAVSRAGREVLAAFERVDRGWFVPRRMWCSPRGRLPQPVDLLTDPELWRRCVYGDTVVVTQFDDGATHWPEVGRVATSSASQPRLVVDMLERLRLRPGTAVLEIGAGTGYNAALLAELAGAERVTTVELDPALAEIAAANLARTGHPVHLVRGDGTLGCPDRAPFDRVVATVAAVGDGLPYAWVEQTRPGGLILTPWGNAYDNGVLLELTVRPDGTAAGPVVGGVAFMQLRGQRVFTGHAADFAELADAGDPRHSAVPPGEVAFGEGVFGIGLRMPEVCCEVSYTGERDYEVLLYDAGSTSAAVADVRDGVVEVRESGPRALWAEVEAAHGWWVGQGRPGLHRFGVTVTPEGQHVWLDRASNTL